MAIKGVSESIATIGGSVDDDSTVRKLKGVIIS